MYDPLCGRKYYTWSIMLPDGRCYAALDTRFMTGVEALEDAKAVVNERFVNKEAKDA